MHKARSRHRTILVHNTATTNKEKFRRRYPPPLFLFLVTVAVLVAGPPPRFAEAFTLKMGLLKVGVPQPWEKSKHNSRYVRKAGVRQFISTYNRVKDLKGDELLFGDEIEYGIFKIDPEKKTIRLSLRAKEIMDELNKRESQHTHRVEGCTWVPEYGAWMVEATPNRPYTGFANDLLRVERNMRLRRKRMLHVLNPDEIAPTVSTFPLLGALGDDGTVPPTKVGGPVTESEYIGDEIINPHPRFGTLTANIRKRRGEKVCIRVPLFRDVNTPEYENLETAADGHGCCGSDSLQLWRYGKGDASRAKYGRDYLVVGCSTSTNEEETAENEQTLSKWLVDVRAPGCLGLFYRSAPNVIVPDADWPRNGDVVVGSEVDAIPGWVRLQNGYYLPMASDDGKIVFLHKVSTKIHTDNIEKRRLGANTPLFRSAAEAVAPPAEQRIALESGIHSLAVLEEELESLAKDGRGAVGLSSSNGQQQPLPTGLSTSEDSMAAAAVAASRGGLERVRAAIHMDAMAFGMGCCCLQVTFQAKDIDESRFIYDQLAVLSPIFMALTASTPILKGRIADTDCRWGIISESVDDRTPAERGFDQSGEPQPEYAGKGQRRMYKSRYDSISTYIYQGKGDNMTNTRRSGLENRVLNMYNDLTVPIEEDSYKMLREAGIDPALSQHIAGLFVRDPLVIFDGAVEELDDETQTEHFENIQSTNWQTVRWKPPPPRNSPNDPHIGWRTEFRTMEMQMTDFENAAFTVFIVLVTRVILTFDLNLYLPLSRVDANMQRAHSRNAAAKGKFFFRRHMAPLEEGDDGYGVKYTSMFSNAVNGQAEDSIPRQNSDISDEVDGDGVSRRRKQSPLGTGSDEENSFELMSMAEIMMGKGDYFPGLIPLVKAYLDLIQCDTFTLKRVHQYLDLIQKRATGELLTPATWMRNFVRGHSSYKGDSVITDEIAYDLMMACKEIGEGKRHEPTLLGDLTFTPITKEGAYDIKLDSKRVENDELVKLLKRYTKRASMSKESALSTLSSSLTSSFTGGPM